MADNSAPAPYGSAHDLPSVIEMTQRLDGMSTLTRFIARDQRRTVSHLQREVKALYDTVDAFYAALGERHWIFTENLPVPDVRDLLPGAPGPEEVERGLISIIGDRIRGNYWRIGLLGHEALRARLHSIERAREHYLNGHWDSCALVLVTVMDGFVNDVEPAARRGLHAREAEEMVAWDSVVGHHLGLTAVMPVFLKTFKRRHDGEVFEVHRHGIVHGTVVNYNNDVVATKAWNLLAAVVDWATAKEKSAEPVTPTPSLRETFGALIDHARASRARETFEPSSQAANGGGFEELEVIRHVRQFLNAWRSKRWAIVARYLPTTITRHDRSEGARALRAKETYGHMPLHDYELDHVSFPMLSVAVVHGHATVGERSGRIEMRWIHEGDDGYPATPNDREPHWALGVFPPHTFWVEDDGSP